MPEPQTLTKAFIKEVVLGDGDKATKEVNAGRTVEVQFNPETLKVVYSNTMKGESQAGPSAIQHVSKSSTKLSVQLWFDATVHDDHDDVRELTKRVNYFITPQDGEEGMVPPGVRFHWGSFLFDGVMESMDETLELFSADGRPIRANVSISLTSQDIMFRIGALPPRGQQAPPGTTAQQQAKDRESVQQMVGQAGGDPAKSLEIAEANNIENARLLERGTYVDLNRRAPSRAGAST